MAAPMPKSVSSLEKRETAQRANVLVYEFCVPFTDGVALYL